MLSKNIKYIMCITCKIYQLNKTLENLLIKLLKISVLSVFVVILNWIRLQILLFYEFLLNEIKELF